MDAGARGRPRSSTWVGPDAAAAPCSPTCWARCRATSRSARSGSSGSAGSSRTGCAAAVSTSLTARSGTTSSTRRSVLGAPPRGWPWPAGCTPTSSPAPGCAPCPSTSGKPGDATAARRAGRRPRPALRRDRGRGRRLGRRRLLQAAHLRALLDGLDGIDLRVAHFLRDPRAAAYSWRRKKLQPDLGPGAFMERRGAGKSAVLWSVWNRSLEMMAGNRPDAYARVTYEEFLADPRAEAQRLLDTFALAGDLDPVFAGPDTVRLSTNHTVAGNPSRHQQGLVPLVADSEWRDKMSADRPRRRGGPDLADAAALRVPAPGLGSASPTRQRRTRGRVLAVSILAPLILLGGCTDSPEPSQPRVSDTPTPSPTPSPTHIAVETPGTSPLGLKWSWFQPDTFDYVRQASGGWTFTEVEWCEVEKVQGQRDWAEIDDGGAESLELGHQPMLKLRTGQCWATQPPTVGGRDTTEATTKTPSTPPIDTGRLPGVRDRGGAALRRHRRPRVRRRERGRRRELLGDRRGGVRDLGPRGGPGDPRRRPAGPRAGRRPLQHQLRRRPGGRPAGRRRRGGSAADLPGALRAAGLQRRLPLAGRRLRRGAGGVLAGVPAQRSIAAEDVSVRLAHDGVVDAYQLHYYEPTSALPELLDHLQERIGDTRADRGLGGRGGLARRGVRRAPARRRGLRAGVHAPGARRAPDRLPAGGVHPRTEDPGVPRPDPRGRLGAALRAGLARPQRRAEGSRRRRPRAR